jgi:hypothetical protein
MRVTIAILLSTVAACANVAEENDGTTALPLTSLDAGAEADSAPPPTGPRWLCWCGAPGTTRGPFASGDPAPSAGAACPWLGPPFVVLRCEDQNRSPAVM